MSDKQEHKPLGERIASIETEIRWVKWLALGGFASSTVGTLLKLGAPPSAAAVTGVLAAVVSAIFSR